MRELFDQTEALQNLLVSQATGGLEDDAEFMRLRQAVLSQAALESHIPRSVSYTHLTLPTILRV